MNDNIKNTVCQALETTENLTDKHYSEKKQKHIEKPWRKSKVLSQNLSDLCDNLSDKMSDDAFSGLADGMSKEARRLRNKAERTYFCGDVLKFSVTDGVKKLERANFCKDRLCPMCTWRKSLKLGRIIQKVVDYLDKDYRYVMLTLTLKNCTDDELSNTLDVFLDGFNYFLKYKECKKAFRGYFRSLECKRALDTEMWHPHIHALIAVKPSYFASRDYIRHDRLRELWSRAVRADYLPQVEIHKIRGDVGNAACEVAKYTIKGDEYIFPDNLEYSQKLVALLDVVLKNRRFATWGGVMNKARKEIITAEESEDLTDADGAEIDEETHLEYYRWNSGVVNYRRLTERGEKITESMWEAQRQQFADWNERRRAGK
jgi:plasmid rolling circle replication initiator protein Rep